MTVDPFDRKPDEPLVVAVTAPFPPSDELVAGLQGLVGDVEVHFTPYSESRDVRASKGANGGVDPLGLPTPEISAETRAIWERAHVFVGMDVPVDVGELAPRLRWIQTISAGVDQIDRAQLDELGIRLSSASGIASGSIAEFVMARMLEVWKHLRSVEQNQREQRWVESFGTQAAGRTMLILGLGSIGREVARRARAFDMRVIATRSSAKSGDTDPAVDQLHPASDLNALLPEADVVVCALPTSPATVDLFDEQRFLLMQPDGIFVNVGRGTLVVEEDLVAVLESGHLRAAILDVMRVEPPPPDDPLWTAPRLYLSPHCAVSLDRYAENAWSMTIDNVGRLLAGERLRNEVEMKS